MARVPTRPSGVDLRVTIGTLRLKNPVIAASGTFGYGVEFAPIVDLNRLGGVVVKGLSLEPMAGAPRPRICETAGGMVNAVGLQNIGVRAFVAEKLPRLRKFNTAVFVNVFGRTASEYVEVIRILENSEGLSGYELNISCPNVDKGGTEFGTDQALAGEVVASARNETSKPLWVKLSPIIDRIGLIAKSCENSGADALVISNTYRAMAIDPHTRKSRLGSTTGGLSGAAVKPITVRLVYEASRIVKIPIIGLGGIEKPDDVVEYMLAGAAAIQVGTAHFVDPRASQRLVDDLERWLGEEKISRISDLQGSFEA